MTEADVVQAGRVRTFHARRGRRSALTDDRLTRLLPRYAVPPGLLDAAHQRRAGVIVEIGCGHGAAALGYATAYPHHHVVAVDVYPAGIARMLAAAEHSGTTNLSAVLGDAVELLHREVGAGSLAAGHLFFPDPWPKTRHRRRRFISSDTLDLLASRLRPQGHVLLATDHDDYAAHVLREVRAHGGFTAYRVPRPLWRPMSGYEAKALDAGRAITDLRLDRVRAGAGPE